MQQIARTTLARIGLTRLPQPVAPEFAHIQKLVAAHTMASQERIAAVVDAVDYLVSNGIDGDVVECGVWRGGSMMAAALRLLEHDDLRTLWLYDTFEGMPEPDPKVDGREAHRRWRRSRPSGAGSDWCLAGIDDVKGNLASTGFPEDRVRFVAGKVEDTVPATTPDRIGLLRLDTDWYQSTRHELQHLTPLVADGGVLLLDDYGHWEGARKAADEWLATWPHPVALWRTDYTGRAAVLHR